MQLRTHARATGHGRDASARRRIRRVSRSHRPYCTTNGCTTYLVPDAAGTYAECPVCGARRPIH